jgi:hypothetical protein
MTDPSGVLGALVALGGVLVVRILGRRLIARRVIDGRLKPRTGWYLIAAVTWLPIVMWVLAASIAGGTFNPVVLAIVVGTYLSATWLFASFAEPFLTDLRNEHRQSSGRQPDQ